MLCAHQSILSRVFIEVFECFLILNRVAVINSSCGLYIAR